MTNDCYIVSLKHTNRETPYITVWRPNDCGYAFPLSWAGKYSQEQVEAHPNYYHRGDDTIAVPCAALDALGVDPERGMIDNDAGPVILNTRENWSAIIKAALPGAVHKPRPQFKGARRQKDKP